MRATAKLVNYEQLELTITLTSSVLYWRTLLDQINEAPEAPRYPLNMLRGAIVDMLTSLDRTHAAKTQPDALPTGENHI